MNASTESGCTEKLLSSLLHKQNLPSALPHGEVRASVSRSADVKSELLQLMQKRTVRLKLASKALGVLSNAGLANRRCIVFGSPFLSLLEWTWWWALIVCLMKRSTFFSVYGKINGVFLTVRQVCWDWTCSVVYGVHCQMFYFVPISLLVGKPNAALLSKPEKIKHVEVLSHSSCV